MSWTTTLPPLSAGFMIISELEERLSKAEHSSLVRLWLRRGHTGDVYTSDKTDLQNELKTVWFSLLGSKEIRSLNL